ncbi:sodium/proton antiporter, CPA1 family [Sphingomonas guangdongensis]|uniref:Sodium/proton antiporter, CPA1 family n=1 Tax=Sphingomonas guangdongensis TaxID=1141890 RepID=A0A285R4X8_9SPHN|nr:cation:proton antiporter [Sphingomonas guangdongensis]SOB87402.1 sodium/proton antiporter, CPA1 family [Sphingomonas guangdongensis]
MTFFESLLVLLLVAIALLQVARRLGLPYPSLLALAGATVALVPGAPAIGLDPATALALFIAPVLLDAAFDFPLATAGRLWRPLAVLAVVAVLATTAVVAVLGWALVGLPIAAAIALGAIVAPPDAAAATAITGTVPLPNRTVSVLKGESLLNDATALLLFSGALMVQTADGSAGSVALRLAAAVPGGILLGLALAWLMRRINPLVAGTLGGNILQFVAAFVVWLAAEHLHLSAVLAVVAFAVSLAADRQITSAPRARVQSFAVWAAVVFLLNVVAFLIMGMQARAILERLSAAEIGPALGFAGIVVVAVVLTRFGVVLAWNWAARRWSQVRGALEPPTPAQGVLVGWCGMRGLVSLAIAFALPPEFPQRDLVTLTAFAVVIATLVVQGLTLAPLIRRLGLDRMEDPRAELATARQHLARAALAALETMPAGDRLRASYEAKLAVDDPASAAWLEEQRRAGLAAIDAQRAALDRLRADDRIGTDSFYLLQEELDWRTLTLLPDEERRIEEA